MTIGAVLGAVDLPQLPPDASEADRALLQALYDQFRDTNQRLWALETTLGIAPRKPTTIPTFGANTFTAAQTITQGTITANAPSLTASQTWNNAAVTFTGFEVDITNSASGASSLLFNIKLGGVSQFSVKKTGLALLAGGMNLGGDLTVAGTTYLLKTTAALTDGAAAQIATMTNGPTAGNPTKWVAVNDAGTVRYSPLW